jgi:hypothetical protein
MSIPFVFSYHVALETRERKKEKIILCLHVYIRNTYAV